MNHGDIVAGADGKAAGEIGVIIVAGYPAVRAGLRALLDGQPEIALLAVWPDDEAAWDEQPDVVLIDVEPGRADLPARLAERFPTAAQALLLDVPGDYRGWEQPQRPVAVLLKEAGAAEIVAAVRAVAQGLIVFDPAIAAQLSAPPPLDQPGTDLTGLTERLTERETQVLQLLALGLPNKTIAMELGISEHTAKFHVGSIMGKLNAASRTEAVTIAARRGLLVL